MLDRRGRAPLTGHTHPVRPTLISDFLVLKQQYPNAAGGPGVTGGAIAGTLARELVKLLIVCGGLSLLVAGVQQRPAAWSDAATAIVTVAPDSRSTAAEWNARDLHPDAPESLDETGIGVAVFISPYLSRRAASASTVGQIASPDRLAGTLVLHLRRGP